MDPLREISRALAGPQKTTVGPITPDVAKLRNELAQLEYEWECFEEALVHCNMALDVEAAAAAAFSGPIDTTIRLATHNLLGELYRKRPPKSSVSVPVRVQG